MMREMGEAMIKRGKEMQKTKKECAEPARPEE